MHELIEDSVYNENVAITIITFTKESGSFAFLLFFVQYDRIKS